MASSKRCEPRFYVLQGAPKGQDEVFRTDALETKDRNLGDAERCRVCGGYISMLRWLPPYRVELETWGREFGDLAFLNTGDDLLVSQRFRDLWKQSEMTGLSGFEPVDVVKVRRYRKVAGQPPPYFKAMVSRSRAAIDHEASGVEYEKLPICQECRRGRNLKRWRAIVIEEGTWSGEDIFIARGLARFLATDRFKSFCEENSIKNAVFTPAEESSKDFYPWEKPMKN